MKGKLFDIFYFSFSYTEMDIKETIQNNLKDQSILEYPVFHFVLPENVQQYREEPYLQGRMLSILL